MVTKTTLPITEVRKRIFEIVEHITHTSQYYTLTDRGVPSVVMMPFGEFVSWIETLDVLDRPQLMKEIRAADRSFKRGQYVSLEQLLQADSNPTKVHVSGSRKKKRSKKSSAH